MSLRADPIYRAMPAKKNPASNIETSDGSEETSEGRRERNFEIQMMDSRGRISSIYEESTLDIDIVRLDANYKSEISEISGIFNGKPSLRRAAVLVNVACGARHER